MSAAFLNAVGRKIEELDNRVLSLETPASNVEANVAVEARIGAVEARIVAYEALVSAQQSKITTLEDGATARAALEASVLARVQALEEARPESDKGEPSKPNSKNKKKAADITEYLQSPA